MMAAMLIAVSCQESLEDRCAREAKEYNDKKCPAKVLDGVTIDSLVFDRSTHTLNYYYTFSGMSNNKEMMSKINPRKILVDELRNSTKVQAYKEAGYNFHYIYFSASTREKLADILVTEKDYK